MSSAALRLSRLPIRRPVVPDKIDLRDRLYQPDITRVPKSELLCPTVLPVLDQGDTNACTGFALANLVNYLTWTRDQVPAGKGPQASPYMLYDMARRYDEFPGSGATGSSIRGAMKGWFRHGACRLDLWNTTKMPAASRDPKADWWRDAINRPLGAYYRVDAKSITDMHVALNELGVVYASAMCHDGWLKGFEAAKTQNGGKRSKGRIWEIPPEKATPAAGGHAFLIVGYDQAGFIVQNSWGPQWGTRGLGRLRYEDWSENGMDAWVAQLGVVTQQRLDISSSVSLRTVGSKVQLSVDATLRDFEISPFVIDMENNGCLSGSGRFRTQPADLDALFAIQMRDAIERWKIKSGEPVDVAIYAHGGLTGEDSAADTAARWVPALFEAHIFPIFLMWETDIWSTLKNRLADLVLQEPRATGGWTDQLKKWWDERLERALAPVGSVIWGEMKQNGQAVSTNPNGGGVLLYESARKSPVVQKHPLRIHLIGHSAGTILHSHLVDQLATRGWSFESINFLAAAVRVKTFQEKVVPHLAQSKVMKFRSFHLTDSAEQKDPTCKPILGYGRSLLYLVSESFENGVRTPILGMQKYFDSLALPNTEAYTAPGPHTGSTTHGDFDNDPLTMKSVIQMIKAGT
ncbi:MAG: C1 family peptidase [Acidobacteria bacterium]|nr:C1 family peptidase [Acidobacteriota bacterium]